MHTQKTSLLLVLLLFLGCADSQESTIATSGTASTTAETTVDSIDIDEAIEVTVPETDNVVAKPESPEPLEIGDPAPSIHFTHWVTGEAIANFEPGKVHVVEFWATWCPPCRASMPHLSSLQDKYGSDVKFMGFSDEDQQTVDGFLGKPSQQDPEKTWAEIVTYALVLDEDRVMHDSYLAATGTRGIPAAFIVGREGNLLWHGHPLEMDKPLEAIVAGDWTAANANEQLEAIAAERVRMQEVQQRFAKAISAKDWNAAVAAFDEMLADASVAAMIGNQAVVQRYYLLTQAGRADEAKELMSEQKSLLWDDSQALNALAWLIAADLPETSERDFDLALEVAERANELTEGVEPAVLDTLAKVYYQQGNLDEAINWQEKAVANSDSDEIAATLASYVAERDGDDSEAGDETEDIEPPADGDSMDTAGSSDDTLEAVESDESNTEVAEADEDSGTH